MTLDAELPPQVYAVLEELPDGRVRYESMDGVQTGWRVGRFVVRDAPMYFGTERLSCAHCGRMRTQAASLSAVVDNLFGHMREIVLPTHADAMLFADEVSRRDRAMMEGHGGYFCAQVHRYGDQGLPVQSFREWQQERDGTELARAEQGEEP